MCQLMRLKSARHSTPVLLLLCLLAQSQGRPLTSSTAAPQQPQSQGASSQGKQQTQGSFANAISCGARPTASTSTADASGRLWGQRGGAACAFKDAAGHALFYVDYQPGSWLLTPPCSMPAFAQNSVTDSKLKTWAWEASGSLCAYKDDQQLPLPESRQYYMLSWAEAPACQQQPTPTATSSAADSFGCLWGWQLERNCAYKDAAGQPVYYKGYSRKCDSAASVKRAAEFNAQSADSKPSAGGPAPEKPNLDTPPSVTGLGCIGQKNAPNCVETNVPVNFGTGPA